MNEEQRLKLEAMRARPPVPGDLDKALRSAVTCQQLAHGVRDARWTRMDGGLPLPAHEAVELANQALDLVYHVRWMVAKFRAMEQVKSR